MRQRTLHIWRGMALFDQPGAWFLAVEQHFDPLGRTFRAYAMRDMARGAKCGRHLFHGMKRSDEGIRFTC